MVEELKGKVNTVGARRHRNSGALRNTDSYSRHQLAARTVTEIVHSKCIS